MNFQVIRKILSKIAIIYACIMAIPLFCCYFYQEETINYLSFLIPVGCLLIFGIIGSLFKVDNSKLKLRESMVIVSLTWILMTLIGAVPFVMSGAIPSFVDAVFETSSGFSTTGSSILTDVEALTNNYHSVMLWRSLTHFIGGMGILVFVLAIIPESSDGSSVFLLRAESPGPQVGRLVSKLKSSSQILYIIYIFLTVVEVFMLWLGPDMDFYESLIHGLGTAGTGGFGIFNNSIAGLSNYTQIVITVFMILFGINFTLFYFLLIGNFKGFFHSEELRCYFIILVVSIAIITFNIFRMDGYNFSTALRDASFQVAATISTTGFSTADYTTWPALSQFVILMLMFFGAMAGSTAGGLKISRIMILIKNFIKKIKNAASPRKIERIRLEGKTITDEMVHTTTNYFVIYIITLAFGALLISFDGKFDLVTNLSASLTCISNVGPGFGAIKPFNNFSGYSDFSKIVLSLEMLIGRLEFLPALMLFNPTTWFKK